MIRIKGTIDPVDVERFPRHQAAHNKYVASCFQVYYSHKLASQKTQKTYLSIVHDKMDKSNTSIPRMGKKEKDFSNVMNLPILLNGMLIHYKKTGGFGHFNLSFLEMASNFTMASLAKCLRSIEEPIVDKYGDFLYKRDTSKNQLHYAMFQS